MLRKRAAVFLCISTLAAGALPLRAQTAREFEVATIKPSPELVDQANVGVHISGSQMRVTFYSLKDYVGLAYQLPLAQVSAPDWMAQARFDIAGKLPDGASTADVPEMLRRLLADKFELRTHRDSKEVSVYALVVGRNGLKLTPSTADSAAAQRPGTVNVAATGNANGVAVDLGGGSSYQLASNRLEITRATTAQITAALTRMMDRPVIDATGLTGLYDMAFDLAPEDYSTLLIRSAVNAGVALPPAALRLLDTAASDPFSGPLQKYGLALESRKAPLDVIVVDSGRKNPIDN